MQSANSIEQTRDTEHHEIMVHRVRHAQSLHRLNVENTLDDARLDDHVGSYDVTINALHSMRINPNEAKLWDETAFESLKLDME